MGDGLSISQKSELNIFERASCRELYFDFETIQVANSSVSLGRLSSLFPVTT